MKEKKVISNKDLPTRAPLLLTCVTYLMLEKFNSPSWLYGVLFTFIAIFWIVFFVNIFNEKQTSVLGNDE